MNNTNFDSNGDQNVVNEKPRQPNAQFCTRREQPLNEIVTAQTPFANRDLVTDRVDQQGTIGPELVSMAQFALYIRKSESQVRRLVKKGALPQPILVGDTPLWSTESIRAWMRSQIGGGAQ